MFQALIRNVRTCRPDAKGEARVVRLHKGQSVGAEGKLTHEDENPKRGTTSLGHPEY